MDSAPLGGTLSWLAQRAASSRQFRALAGIQLDIKTQDEPEHVPNAIRGVSVDPLAIAVFALGVAPGATQELV